MKAAMSPSLRPGPLLIAISFLFLAIVADAREARAESVQDFLLNLEAGDIGERRKALIWLAEHADETAVLPILAALKQDADEGVRNLAETALWSIWTRSGDSEVDHLMKIGTFLMVNGEFQRAELVFSEIIGLKPDFAEGYNKRKRWQVPAYLASTETAAWRPMPGWPTLGESRSTRPGTCSL